jgi:hypothetical protein
MKMTQKKPNHQLFLLAKFLTNERRIDECKCYEKKQTKINEKELAEEKAKNTFLP